MYPFGQRCTWLFRQTPTRLVGPHRLLSVTQHHRGHTATHATVSPRRRGRRSPSRAVAVGAGRTRGGQKREATAVKTRSETGQRQRAGKMERLNIAPTSSGRLGPRARLRTEPPWSRWRELGSWRRMLPRFPTSEAVRATSFPPLRSARAPAGAAPRCNCCCGRQRHRHT